MSVSRSDLWVKVREDAGKEAPGLGPERRGHAGRGRPPQKLLVLFKYQDILNIGMRPHVGTGHRRSIPGKYNTERARAGPPASLL